MLLYQKRNETEELPILNLPYSTNTLKRLLAVRGIANIHEAERFLHPTPEHLHDPYLMIGMQDAVDRIKLAKVNGEKVTIYGDYDVDGISASTILCEYLNSIGIHADVYIPNRHQEGYGLNIKAIMKIARQSKLLITVDCGISNVDEVMLAKGLKLDVIVTDHHQLGEKMPNCICINPLMANYPFGKLCGAGVALKVVQALGGIADAKKYWDIAALGTVADLVPLIDENRVIVHMGLKAINGNPRPGIKALIDASSLTDKEITSGNIAFQLAPRLNASGRLLHAITGVELLRAKEYSEAFKIAQELNGENGRRQSIELEMLGQAEELLKDNFNFFEDRVIVVCGEGWNPGIIGLVASKLTEKYNFPSVVLSLEGNLCKGSCRSIKGIDIFAMLVQCSDLLVKFGGHKQAAGLTIQADMVDAFKVRLNAAVKAAAIQDTFVPCFEYDMDIDLDEITLNFVNELESMQPFGIGNPAPLFRCIGNAMDVRTIGKNGDHLKLTLKGKEAEIGAIAFGKAYLLPQLSFEQDILFNVGINEWNGEIRLQAELKALKPNIDMKSIDVTKLKNELFPSKPNFVHAFLTEILYNGNNEEIQPSFEVIKLSQVKENLFSSLCGNMIVTTSSAAAVKVLSELGEAASLLDILVSWPTDKRCHNCLVICPDEVCEVAYKNIYFAGPANKKLVERARAGTCIQSIEDVNDDWIKAYMPTDDELRATYSFIKTNESALRVENSMSSGIRKISEWLSQNEVKVELSLRILDELGLIKLSDEMIKLLPFKKVALTQSIIYCNTTKYR